MRRGHGKQSSKFCFLNGNVHLFPSFSLDILMWKRERTGHMFVYVMKIIGDSPLSRPFHGQKSEIKQNLRIGSYTQSCVCLSPLSCIQHGSYTNIPATHSLCD